LPRNLFTPPYDLFKEAGLSTSSSSFLENEDSSKIGSSSPGKL
jgi:hypothetical protein